MNIQRLRIRYSSVQLGEPKGWFVHGTNVERWLSAIANSECDQQSAKLYVIPTSFHDRVPIGLLVECRPSCVRITEEAVPYQHIGSNLFIPANATLEPFVSAEEIANLFSGTSQFVWHPSAGLIEFESKDILRVADLLDAPIPQCVNWMPLETGVVLAPHLVSIHPAHFPTIDDVIDGSQSNIGGKSPNLKELPRSPGEQTVNPLAAGAASFAGMAASSIRAFQKLLGNAGTSWASNTLGKMLHNAGERLQGISDNLRAKRDREIERLLHMLSEDPEKGLRYALPTGSGAARGVAPPGTRLGERDPNFSLSGIGGGGPVDYWDISWEQQQRLNARYRELANRESRLGQYRRAAYIFAHLLSDYSAAAEALKAGRHWREAAVLFRDKLGQPLKAADCLLEGGLLLEAIEIYRDHKHYETIGDLYQRLEQHDDARAAYLAAVESYRRKADHLAAAKTLEIKVGDMDGALSELEAGWPYSRQAAQCLQELFRALQRHSRHNDVKVWIDRLRDGEYPTEQGLAVVEELARLATSYPDPTAKKLATDSTLVVAARHLQEGDRSLHRRYTSAVRRLHPEDQLLGRDCQRFTERHTRKVFQKANPQRARGTVRLVRDFRLDSGTLYKNVAFIGKIIYAVGLTEGTAGRMELTVTRATMDGKIQHLDGERLPIQPEYENTPIILVANSLGDDRLQLHLPGSPAFPNMSFTQNDDFPLAMSVGAVPGMSGVNCNVLEAARGVSYTTWVVESWGDSPVLRCVDREGRTLWSRLIATREAFADWLGLPVLMYVHSHHVYVAYGNRILVCNTCREFDQIDLGRQITYFSGSMPNSRARIAASFERGGIVLWRDDSEYQHPFGESLDSPRTCINRGGLLVAVDSNQCEVYNTVDGKIQLKGTLSSMPSDPIAVIPGDRPDQFSLAWPDGVIRVYGVT